LQTDRLIPKAIRQSLRYRLLAFLLLSLLVLMSITMVVGKRTADHEFGEILDGHMITTGRALFSVIALELREGDASKTPALLDEFVRLRQGLGDWVGENQDIDVYDNEFYLQLVDPLGNTLFASHKPPLLHLEKASPGLFKVGKGNNQWHVFGLQDPTTGYTFYTGQSQMLRHELSSESIEYILLPFLLVTIVILGVIWLGTRYGLKPLIQLTQELDRRTPDALDTIDIKDKATELRPLIVALNRLFMRVSTSLTTERQFSADASHELRTPLAGIKANLDAARFLSKVPEQEKYLNNIESCVDNATQVTEGLLLLSRLQSAEPDEYFEVQPFNVQDTVHNEITKRAALHPDWEQRIAFVRSQGQEPIMFNGAESLVAIAVGNILDNALKYSTQMVDVEINFDTDKNIVVSVKDRGPGIPENAGDLIFQRFYRINTNTTKGFGLGLALVQQIMKALRGDVQLSMRPLGGLDAKLIFPFQSTIEYPDT
jgi:two-component system sensor histidine kinase QseC